MCGKKRIQHNNNNNNNNSLCNASLTETSGAMKKNENKSNKSIKSTRGLKTDNIKK